ncbi:hypothetical protein C7N43_24820 [Sphingobacteriales bacterium UPWRP_1]|nr:hypothetical protein B6N25_09575 [Sphingobacteriales bacterium TSM_CSS]PSJ74283.1 hypothetical protein C7N43_24820 [Sphingobacteriales bacterium UPWRP_1]
MNKLFARLFAVFIGLFFCAPLFAESYVFFQNNTSLPIQINTSQNGSHALADVAWWGKDGTIAPWQKETNIWWANRNKGIKNGKDYLFTISLSAGTDTIQFLVNIKGWPIGSGLKFTLVSPNATPVWYHDKEFHEATFMLNGKLITAKFAAYNTRTAYSDMMLVLHELHPYPTNPIDLINPDVVNILSYNIYMLTPPLAFTNQETRAEVIPNYVHGYDAIIFSEAFYNSARRTLLEGLAPEYPYHTQVLNNPETIEDGGVIIVSRWPIEFTNQLIYNNCEGEDCFASKGVMYARINKLGRTYHLFGTHMQAWKSDAKVSVRQEQLQQVKQFINQQQIPDGEPILIGGDLNVDKIENKADEYCRMLSCLQVNEPTYCPYPYTCNGLANHYYAESANAEYLDYILPLSTNGAVPLKATNQVRILRAIEDKLWNIFDLSDHFSVCGRFVFPAETLAQNADNNQKPVYMNAEEKTPDEVTLLNRFTQYVNTLHNQSDTMVAVMVNNLSNYFNSHTAQLLTDAGTIADTAAIKQQLRQLQQQGNVMLMMQPSVLPLRRLGR